MTKKVYPAHASPNYHIWPKSPYIVVLLHGQNPHGYKYCETSFLPMITMLNEAKISNILYYRSYTYTTENLIPDEELTETIRGQKCQKTERYQIEEEFASFKQTLKNIKREFGLHKQQYVFVGHSLGGLYAAVFGVMYKHKCIKTISLDGFNFFEVIPFFMQTKANIKVAVAQIEYEPKGIKYKGEPFPLDKIGVSQQLYEMAYVYRNDMLKSHYVVDYFENRTSPEKVSVTKMPNDKYYKNKYAIKYGNEYFHSLHLYQPVAKAIVDQFILNDK